MQLKSHCERGVARRQTMGQAMITNEHLERLAAPPSEDARDLLARLCRELGVAAVAAELQIPEACDYEPGIAKAALELAQQSLAA